MGSRPGRIVVLAAGTIAAFVGTEAARADAPALLPIQGFLTDAAGTPVDGMTELTFGL
jgi:hypothetical protein